MDKELKKIVEPALKSLADRIKQNHRQLTSNAFGDTLKSLTLNETAEGYQIAGEDYFETVSESLKLGRKPQNMTQLVETWAKAKGVRVMLEPYVKQANDKWSPSLSPYERGLKRLTDLATYKLAKEGTSLDRLQNSSEVNDQEIPKAIEKIKEKITAYYVQEIRNRL